MKGRERVCATEGCKRSVHGASRYCRDCYIVWRNTPPDWRKLGKAGRD